MNLNDAEKQRQIQATNPYGITAFYPLRHNAHCAGHAVLKSTPSIQFQSLNLLHDIEKMDVVSSKEKNEFEGVEIRFKTDGNASGNRITI